MSLRTKLITLIAASVALLLMVLTAVQMRQGQEIIVNAAEQRVARHIDMAWQVIRMREQELRMTVALLSDRDGDIDTVARQYEFDVLALVDPDSPQGGTLAAAVARRFAPAPGETATGFIALVPEDLQNEPAALRERCMIDGAPAPAMALFAAGYATDGRILVAAQILTRADELLWRLQRGLFGDEYYKGKRTGTVTIFTGTQRTSTTVLRDDLSSAVGTRVSEEVARRVLIDKESWIGPAVVVGARYLSCYDPIREPDGQVIGMLYIGELESRLLDRKLHTVFIGVGSIAAVLLLALLGGVIIIRLERRIEAQRRRVRFEFLRVLGHELKAPINAVEGYLRLLDDQALGAIPEPYRKMVDRSILRIEHMRKLIADLLDLTRIEAGEKHREIVDGIDLAAILREGVETVEPEAQQRGIAISVEAPAALPIRADRGELSIICNNLLTNAVKYNREGGRIDARLARDGRKVVLTVSDTGIGMSGEEQAMLFGEFVRIKNEKTRDILGSGLGLNILKKIVGLYGGQVALESEPDVGSTFKVTLIAEAG